MPRLIPALIALAFSGSAAASGFQLQNQTGSGNGNAFAGAAAAAEDAGTIFFNPAGMSYLPAGHNISLSGTLLNRNINFSNKGSTVDVLGPGAAFFPLPTGNGGNAGGLALLPHGYWAMGVTPNLSVGVGVGPTFGNTTEYDFDFVGRNAGYFFEMKQININPSIAYKVSEKLSLGFGINIAHNESHFKQGVSLVDPTGITTGGIPFPANNFLDVKGDDWAVGYNFGAMFQLSPSTRVGIAYRSELKFELEGKQEYAAQNALLRNQDIKAILKTPANLSMAVSQKLNDKWEMLGDLTWTDWSVVDTLYLQNKDTGAALHKLPYNFKDTWRIGFGANYLYSDKVKVRFGIAHDKSPVKSAADRTMTLPDADRTWLSIGAKYSLTSKSSLDVGYTHIFFADAQTARAVTTGYPGPETLRQTIRGDIDTSVDILSVQYNHNF
ncbi:MAG: OmpP1/FadL family transporter [Rhodocyclaceae bacterium]|jgi:long-chain fatty acid transport protein